MWGREAAIGLAFPNSRLSPPPSPFPPVAVPLSPLPPPHLTRPHTAAASLKGRFEVRVCDLLSLAAHRHHFTPPPHPAQRREKETLLSVQGRFIARSNHYPIHIPRHCTALPNAQRWSTWMMMTTPPPRTRDVTMTSPLLRTARCFSTHPNGRARGPPRRSRHRWAPAHRQQGQERKERSIRLPPPAEGREAMRWSLHPCLCASWGPHLPASLPPRVVECLAAHQQHHLVTAGEPGTVTVRRGVVGVIATTPSAESYMTPVHVRIV